MPADLSATGYVVLGLVSVRPSTGHELTAFAERSIGQFFSLTRSHVYSELERLCRLGLLDAIEIPQDRFPTKRVYEITEQGLDVLGAWLDDPEPPPERHRNLFLVRVFFGDRMSSDRLEELLDGYERSARSQRDQLTKVVDRLAGRRGSEFRRAAAMYGLAHAQASLDWIVQIRRLLTAPTTADTPC
jgi:DNA-binding PadR family transcriptional regulator